jgi:uncharacterized protein YvpB
MMVVNKVLIFCFIFSGMVVGDVQALWEEEYVELVQKYLAQQADTTANEAVIQPKKPKDVA